MKGDRFTRDLTFSEIKDLLGWPYWGPPEKDARAQKVVLALEMWVKHGSRGATKLAVTHICQLSSVSPSVKAEIVDKLYQA